MRRLKPWLPGLVLGLALALLVLGPGLRSGGLVGHESLDNWSHAWGMHWFVSSLAEGRLPWVVEGAAFPEHRVLWYVDPLGALLTAPLQLLSPAAAYDGLLLFQVAAAGFAGWLWGRSLGGQGWLAGCALATTPLLQTELWNGVPEACWLAPVALSGCLAARRSRLTGLAVGLAALATPYHGLGAAGLAGVLLLTGGRDGEGSWRERGLDCAVAALLTLLLAWPQLRLLTASMESTSPFVHRPVWDAFNDPSLRTNAVDPVALVHPGDFWSRETVLSPLSSPWRHTPYLGWLLLALSALGLGRGGRLRWLLLPLGLAVVASLGFFLWHDGDWYTNAQGMRLKLPFAFVVEGLGISLVHHLRFIGVAIVVLAGLADRAAGRWGVWLAPLVCLEHLVLAPNCWPLPSSPAGLPEVLAQLPDDGRALIDLPADSGKGNRTNRYLYWQALHGHPVPWVNKVGSMGTASMNPALRTWVLVSAQDPPSGGFGVPSPDDDLDAATRELSAQGFGWVALHPELLAEPRLLEAHKQAVSGLLGEPREVGGAWLWELPAP